MAAGLASCDETNVNSACDVTDLDQIGPISVQGLITTVQNRGSAEPRQLIGVLRWCYTSWLELGSNLRSTLNLVQLNQDLIDVGETRPKWLSDYWTFSLSSSHPKSKHTLSIVPLWHTKQLVGSFSEFLNLKHRYYFQSCQAINIF